MKRLIKKMGFLILVILYAFGSYAQQAVEGTIMDENNDPLPGASVIVKGTTNGMTTDFDGKFKLNVSENEILVISFIGYKTKEVEYTGQRNLSINLEQDVVGLEEVVAIGYGTTTKKEVTGSVATMDSEEFNKGDKTDAMGLLQGKVAGLTIVNARGGDPNQDAEFLLRGRSTMSGGVSPLIIVDGVPGVSLKSVSPSSIKSIDVLKDGSAAAIYGTRGTNGVIIITTKAPKKGEAVVELNSYVSTQTVTKKLENLSASEFRDLLKIKYPGNEASYDYGASTDWFDEITRTPFNHNTELSLTGGSNTLSYRAFINYHENKGLVIKNSLDRLNASIMINQKGFDNRLKVNYKLAYTTLESEISDTYALQQAFRYNPTEPVYDDSNPMTGGYSLNTTPFQYFNPVAMINERENISKKEFITGSLDTSFEIFKGFSVGAQGSILKTKTDDAEYRTKFYPNEYGLNGTAEKSTSNWQQKLLELRTEYTKKIGKHSLQAFAGYSFQEQEEEGFYAINRGFDFDFMKYHNLGAGSDLLNGSADMGSEKSSSRLISFYGRAMYNYESKYLVSASIRREGSSRFGKDQKWGTFPAVSVGWVATSEPFMSNIPWFNYLKLRAGYGLTGNQNIPNYMSLQLLSSGEKLPYNGQWINTYAPSSNENPDLKWEEKEEINLGFDYALFDSKVSGTLDLYTRNTYDLLWWYNVPVTPNLYPQTYDNVGQINNKGIEFTLNYNAIKTSDFSWTSTINYSLNRNKLKSFSDEDKGYELSHIDEGFVNVDIKAYTIRIEEGKPLGNFYAPVFLGLEEREDGTYPIYKEVDGNEGFNADTDREYVGNAYPKFRLGWNNYIKYKNFDFSVFLRGVFGHDILNWHRMYYENFMYFGSKNILRSSLDDINYKGLGEYSSRYVEDASYVKLDNITLGYTFKPNKVFKSLRVYFTGQQLFTITNYKGVDPEITLGGLAPGVDNYSYYPRVRTYILGFNMTF